jgi:RNA polymerase sigma-70 factor (ECF subfamily)
VGDPRFHTTRWSLVLAAGEGTAEGAREALGILLQSYWFPLYAYARRQGADPPTAEDRTQGFFAALLEKGWIATANHERGRFRTFLLTAFKRYLSHQAERDRAQKRGGGATLLSIDSAEAERRYAREPSHEDTPDRAFDRAWALTLLRRVMDDLARELAEAGKADHLRVLRPHLNSRGSAPPQEAAARELGISEGALRIALHRLRRRYRALLRRAIAETLGDPHEVDAEITHLLAILRR